MVYQNICLTSPKSSTLNIKKLFIKWMAIIRREWAIFNQLHVRLLRGDPHDGMMLPEGCADQSIHSGRINTLTQYPSLPSLQLVDCEDSREAADYVAECHQAFARLNPNLALEIRWASA